MMESLSKFQMILIISVNQINKSKCRSFLIYLRNLNFNLCIFNVPTVKCWFQMKTFSLLLAFSEVSVVGGKRVTLPFFLPPNFWQNFSNSDRGEVKIFTFPLLQFNISNFGSLKESTSLLSKQFTIV